MVITGINRSAAGCRIDMAAVDVAHVDVAADDVAHVDMGSADTAAGGQGGWSTY